MSQWPVWLVAALLVLNLFKDQIGAAVPAAVREGASAIIARGQQPDAIVLCEARGDRVV